MRAARAVRPAPPAGIRRLGPERLALSYDDPHAAAKALLLARINRDRAGIGVAPVALEPRGSRVGDLFCADQARTGAAGHWDVAGRAPYVRWGLAGGVDYHVENAGFLSSSSGRLEQSLEALLLDAHEKMMAEVPPDDGHRRIILDPLFTHVGIGIGAAGPGARLLRRGRVPARGGGLHLCHARGHGGPRHRGALKGSQSGSRPSRGTPGLPPPC